MFTKIDRRLCDVELAVKRINWPIARIMDETN